VSIDFLTPKSSNDYCGALLKSKGVTGARTALRPHSRCLIILRRLFNFLSQWAAGHFPKIKNRSLKRYRKAKRSALGKLLQSSDA
jgi:hypothetical protein